MNHDQLSSLINSNNKLLLYPVNIAFISNTNIGAIATIQNIKIILTIIFLFIT